MINDRKNSEAKIRAVNKYSAKAYDRISLIVHKGDKAKIKSAADDLGESLNQYINTAIKQRLDSGQ